MIELLRRYLRLMRTHDFSYWYSDDHAVFTIENDKRTKIIMLKAVLLLGPKGRRIVAKAERKYGYV
jgi:hypothetical protein